MQERRVNRLESLIKEKVATVFLRDMSDPRLGLVTITRVKLDRELSTCKIYWTVFGDEKKRRLNERTLRHAAGFIRREIASVLHTRSVPTVTFVYDESILGSMRVDAILKQLRENAPPRPPEAAEGEASEEDAAADPDKDDNDEDDNAGGDPPDQTDEPHV